MDAQAADQLIQKKCKPCEGGVERYSLADAESQLVKLDGWWITHEGQRIRKNWTVRGFMDGIRFFDVVAELAESEQHHPDLHLEGYRKIWIELWTHAIQGLSENDFILAAKIDELPIALKK